ncbi:MAG: putative CXXCH cytochrome family protein [Desulforhopalus sp.]|jgi:predicted CXXCH cytochrome family protein
MIIHDAHGSAYKQHLLAKPMDLCLKCHSQEVIDDKGKSLANIDELLVSNKMHHGPIKDKNCSGCHSPHGSNYYRMLLAEYPKEFYTTRFNKDDYNLCFLCHDSRLLDEKETTKLTKFRDGSKNLHYLHVNRSEKGRTCRACHEVHASNNYNHIREAVPFGKINWMLHLMFEPLYVNKKTGLVCDELNSDGTQNGGSCIACHNRKFYDNSITK